MIKLERYQLTNYKSINDQIKDLGLVNIFIGENGCGKSNLLESIKYGFEFLRSYNIIEREGEIFPSIFTYDSKGHKDTSLEFTVEIESSYLLPLLKAIYAGIEGDRSSIERIIEENPTLYLTLFYQYVIGSRGKEFINLHEISINRPHNEGYKSQLLRINVIGGNIHILKLPTLEQNLTGTTSHGTDSISRNDEKNFIKKEISNLLKTFSEKVLYITKNESFIKEFQDFYFSEMKYFKPNNDISNSKLMKIINFLQIIFENVEWITFEKNKFVIILNNGEKRELNEMGDGFSFILEFIYKIFRYNEKEIILFDEPERGIHPRTQKELLRLIKLISETESMQFFITTHSVDLIDPQCNIFRVVLLQSVGKIITNFKKIDPDEHSQIASILGSKRLFYDYLILVEGDVDELVLYDYFYRIIKDKSHILNSTFIYPVRGISKFCNVGNIAYLVPSHYKKILFVYDDDDQPNDPKEKFEEYDFDTSNIIFHKWDRNQIENYLPINIICNVLKKYRDEGVITFTDGDDDFDKRIEKIEKKYDSLEKIEQDIKWFLNLRSNEKPLSYSDFIKKVLIELSEKKIDLSVEPGFTEINSLYESISMD